MKLTPLGTKSVYEKKLTMEGCPLTVEITLHKATKMKEVERV